MIFQPFLQFFLTLAMIFEINVSILNISIIDLKLYFIQIKPYLCNENTISI